MKPDWDKLMAEFAGSADLLVGDVDCTAGGKSLCNDVGIRGYPSIKHGAPGELQDYKGSRAFADLKKFADGLGPQCSPANLDLCNDEKKAQIQAFQAMAPEERTRLVQEKEGQIEKLESEYKAFVDSLQKLYSEAQEKKDADLAELRGRGLGLLKAVQAHAARAEL